MNKLFILTLSWNGKDKLQKLYPTLVSSLNNLNWTWLIKDNGSNDNTSSLNDEWKNSNINIIKYPNNKDNFSQGCNFLFKEANPQDEDYVMLLNNDIVFNDTASINNMISLMEKDKSIGIVGSRLLYSNTNKLQHAGVVFNPVFKTPMHFRANEISDDNAEQNREFQAITGAVCITKALYYRTANTNTDGTVGLDNQYFWAFDDTDLSLSIKYNLDKKVVYCGKTNISHEESASLKKNPVNKMFLKHNLQYFFNKWQHQYQIDQDIYTNNPKHNLYIGNK